jgi:excisionase family DNA binding protein
MAKRFYTTSDVARICNVHRNTIIGSIRKGLLKIYRTPGGHARVAEDDLLEFCRLKSLPINLGGSRNDKVLVVDDDPLLLRVVQAGLTKAGYRVKVAKNGYDAGFLTLDWRPDIMLLDIMLPDIHGDLVAKRVRQSEQTEKLPIIAMSAVADQRRIDDMMEAGANDFVAKPFKVEQLKERIHALIGAINESVPVENEADEAAA